MSQSFKPYYSEKDNGDNNEDQVVEGLTQIEQDETPTKSNGKTVKTKNKNFMASQVDIISSSQSHKTRASFKRWKTKIVRLHLPVLL